MSSSVTLPKPVIRSEKATNYPIDKITIRVNWPAFLDAKVGPTMRAYEGYLRVRSAPSDPTDIMQAVETVRVLRQPAMLLSEALLARGNPGHHFIVTYPSPSYAGRLRVCHAIELPLLFGTYNDPRLTSFTGSGQLAQTYSARMQEAWSAFACSGYPSCDLVGHWPTYGALHETMMMGEGWLIEHAPFADGRQYWSEMEGDPWLGIM